MRLPEINKEGSWEIGWLWEVIAGFWGLAPCAWSWLLAAAEVDRLVMGLRLRAVRR